MSTPDLPIEMILQNFCANLPVFVPREDEPARIHRYWTHFYNDFAAAAQDCGIPTGEQSKVLERAQNTLWAFGRLGQPGSGAGGPFLELGQPALSESLKFPRPAQTFALLGRLGAAVELLAGPEDHPADGLKTCTHARLRFPGDPAAAAALHGLAGRILAAKPKDKPAFERFLRADPEAVLAGDKPPLALPPDAPAILANLPAGAAEGWREIVQFLAGYPDFQPTVEFRAIQHGLWTVNYDSKRGGRDLCGLVVQNRVMTVRVILYGQKHFEVKDHLEDFGEPVISAFHNAHYYEEFEHQWLFIPCASVEDTAGIKLLLSLF